MTEDLFGEDSPEERSPAPSALPGPGDWREPLAARLRPVSFDEYVGQDKLVGPEGALRRLIERDRTPSMILWGPPGSGKTSLATLVARETESDFIALSAVTAGLKDVRQAVSTAKTNRQYARRTILFLDEIHRFNKAQQDALLPHVESGLLTLIGATTENPSFSVISPLLSRCRVFVLDRLGREDLAGLLERGLAKLSESGTELLANGETLGAMAELSDGDARRALGVLEVAADLARARQEDGAEGPATITIDHVKEVAQRHLVYDRGGEEHYNLISALHKTLRSSDPHGAAYWCERMMAAGEDPRFILRRLVRAASEDIGLADPFAVVHAVACLDAFERIGSPEGDLFVTQLAVYLATAPKSNAVYKAHNALRAEIRQSGALPVPLHLRNAPTRLMKDLDYGKDYTYDHDAEGGFAAKQGLPDVLADRVFYEPVDRGREARIREQLAAWDEERRKAREGRRHRRER